MSLLQGIVRTAIVSGTATAVSNRVSRRQAERWAEQDGFAYEQEAPAPVPASPAAPDYMAELEKFAQLRDQGVITADDFEAKKKSILGI